MLSSLWLQPLSQLLSLLPSLGVFRSCHWKGLTPTVAGFLQSTQVPGMVPSSLQVKRHRPNQHLAGRLERGLLLWMERQMDLQFPPTMRIGVFSGIAGLFYISFHQILTTALGNRLSSSSLHKWENRLREVKQLAKGSWGVESELEARTSFCPFSGDRFLDDWGNF